MATAMWPHAPEFKPTGDSTADEHSAWAPDDTAAGAPAGFEPDGGAYGDDENEFTGEFSNANVSKHANDGGCRICGVDGHFARDCPDKKPNTGECFNCGEMGHSKAECTNDRVERPFTGTCRLCEQEGHRAAECPLKPPTLCKICKVEGHNAAECTENRLHLQFASLVVGDIGAEEAWKAVELADYENEIEDVKSAIIAYAKAYPELTLTELEQTFRDASMNTFLIAKKQDIADTHTIVNLQGQPDQKYVLSFQKSAKPRRAKFAEGWPETPEENLVRLAEAGFVMDSLVTKCSNCGEIGHTRVKCEQEKQEARKVIITCANCSGTGHRARDCPEERKSNKRGCRNCGDEGHIAKECPEPRSAENVECKGCGEMGHFARDCPNRPAQTCRNCDAEGHKANECPEPKNMAKMQCRNCDVYGHTSRECPEPTDWSRVECTNCHEKGHSYKRCKQPPADEQTGGDGGWGDGNTNGTATHGAAANGTNGEWAGGAGNGGW